jgi:hypothetical protein
MEHAVRQSVSTKSAAHRLTRRSPPALDTKNPQEQPDTEVRRSSTPTQRHNPAPSRTIEINTTPTADRWIKAKPTLQQSAIRNSFTLLAIIPYIGGLLGVIAYIVIAVTINNSPTKQGKHDELAGGTQVVKG